MKHRLLLLLAIPLLPACAARTTIEPIGEGRTAYNVSIGGPLVSAFDTYVPIPNLTLGLTHGVSDRVDVGGSLYLLPMLYGDFGLDVGATWYPLVDSDGTTIALQPRVMAFSSFRDSVEKRFRAYPAISASAAWHNGDDRIYTGFDLLLYTGSFDYDNDPAPVVLSPFVGYRWSLGSRSRLLTELKWHGVNVRTNATVEYVNPLGQGGLAPFIGYELLW